MLFFLKNNYSSKKFLKVFFSVLALIFINYPALAEYKPGTGIHDAQENIIKQVLLETGKKFGWDQRACFYSIHEYATVQGMKEEKIRHCPKIVGPNKQYDIDKKDANGNFMIANCSAYFLTVYVPPKGVKSGGTLPDGAMMVETSPIKIIAFPSEALAESWMKDEIKSVSQSNKIVVAKMGKKWATKIIKFHGTDAMQSITGFTWKMGRFIFGVTNYSYDPSLKGKIVDVPYMKLANTLYDIVKSYGLIGKGASPQDSDGDGVPDTEDKCPNTPSGVAVDARGCEIIKEMQLTLSTDKKAYSAGETVVIKGNVSNEKGGLAGATVAIDIKGTKVTVTSDASGNYRLKFPIPPDITQGAYTVTATASHANYPSRKKSMSFIVGKIGIQLEENSVTGKPFVGVAADGVSSLRISISLPGCSDVKINKPDIGKLKGDAINVLGNVNLDSTGLAEITYYPPDYLTKDQLTKNLNVPKSNSKTWVAEVPLTLTYKDANGDQKKLESKILICRPPVMLVHGFLGGPTTWGKMSTTLRGEKFDTYLGDYGATGQSIEGLAVILKNDIRKQKIDYARANIKLAKVDIVGHSMGGLISRYYTHGRVPANYPGDVRKLIMVGTPNHGVSWTKMILGHIGSETYETHLVPALQLESEDQFMKIVNYGEKTGAHLDPDIQYGNIYGYPDDWVVSAASAHLNGVAEVTEYHVKHSADIPVVPGIAITKHKKTFDQVKEWLRSDIYRPALEGWHVEVYKYHGDVYRDLGKLTSSPVNFGPWESLWTDKNSTAIVHLTLNGHPWGAIFLDPESEIFLGYTSPQLVEVRLWKGTATFRSGKKGHFTVPVHIKRSKNGEWWKYSPQAVVTGRGTEFIVSTGDSIKVHCLEGELVVNTPNATKGSILSANKSVAVTGENIVAITPVSKGDFWWSNENDNFLNNTSSTAPGLPGNITTIKDWDQRHEAFSFSLGKVTTKEGIGDFFIADRGDKSIIHVFDSPGIIDMGAVSLDSISEAPKSGYKEVANPIEGHSYVIRSQGKYGKIHIEDVLRPPVRTVTEYEITWVYQPDGTRGFGAAPAPTSSSPTMSTITPSADAYVYAYNYRNWNRSNRGKYDQLRAGWHPTGGESRAYIKFDLSNVDPSKVTKAVLKLYHFQTAGNDNVNLGIYRVTGPWKEGADTYHSGRTEKTAAPGELSWVQQPPIDTQAVSTFNPGHGLGDWTEVDITPLVKQWLNGTPNYGLVIKPIGQLGRNVGASVYHFASRERKANLDKPKGESKAPTLILSTNLNGSNTSVQSPTQSLVKTTSKFKNTLSKPCASDKEFIRSLYQSILDRNPKVDISLEPGHGAAHLHDLQNGVSRWRIIWNFFNSPEYKKRHKNHHDFIRDVYQAVLGREPKAKEINSWPKVDRNNILRKFFNSDEYLRIKRNCKSKKLSSLLKNVTGKWKWFNGVIVTINKYGKVSGSNGGKGKVSVNSSNNIEYIFKWNNGYTDNLKLHGDTLDGHNQNSTHVWGKRIHPESWKTGNTVPNGMSGQVNTVTSALSSGTYRVEQGHWKSTWKLRVSNGRISGTSEWSCCPGHRIDAVRGTISGNSVVIERDCSGKGWKGVCRQTYEGTIKGNRITGPCMGTGLTAGATWVLYLNGGTPPQSSIVPSQIGSIWQVIESCVDQKWIGTWTRRSGTEIFDAIWKSKRTGHEVRDVIDFKGVKNGIVTLYRRGIGGMYTGKISPDGTRVRDGDASWYHGHCHWTATSINR